MRIISLYPKTKYYCFLTIRRVYHQFFQNLILPAVTIKLYCFKLLFEHHFSLNKRLLFLNNGQYFLFWLSWQRTLKWSKIHLPSSNSLQRFKQIKQKTPEILHFHFFIVLQHCVCDVISKWKWGWKSTKWRCPSCPNSWLRNGISREPFGALRSVIARVFFHFSRSFIWAKLFFRPEVSFNSRITRKLYHLWRKHQTGHRWTLRYWKRMFIGKHKKIVDKKCQGNIYAFLPYNRLQRKTSPKNYQKVLAETKKVRHFQLRNLSRETGDWIRMDCFSACALQ